MKYLAVWLLIGLLVGYVAGRKQGGSLAPYILSGLFLGFLSPVLFWVNFTESTTRRHSGLGRDYGIGTGGCLDENVCDCGYPFLPDDRECKVCGYSNYRPEGYDGFDT
jgi:hypothetical protein